MRRPTLTATLVAPLAALALTACGGATTPTAQTATSAPSAASASASSTTSATSAASAATGAGEGAATDFLARNGLAGKDVTAIVAELDRSQDDKARGLEGSVRTTELQLTDSTGAQASIPLPADKTYVSFAPYETTTHPCTWHHLTGCQGELTDATIHVTIKDDTGATLVDEDTTTYVNGFVGYWLPRGRTGTVTVTRDGRTATTPLSTKDGDPTCVTTLRLS